MNKNVLIAIIVILLVILGIVMWTNNPKQTIAPEVSNTNQNTNTEAPASNTNNADIQPISQNEEFENELGSHGNNWVLWKVTVDQKVVDMSMNVPSPLTLQFDPEKNTYKGFAGCNNFSGMYSSANNYAFDFGSTVSTKMACPKTMELENAIFKTMDAAVSYGIKGKQLVFTSKDGYTEIVYDPAI